MKQNANKRDDKLLKESPAYFIVKVQVCLNR